MSQTQNKPQNDRANEEIQKIDIVTLCLDFLRSFRRMWGKVLLLTIIVAVIFGYLANERYCAYYTASATFTINIREEQENGSTTTTSFFDNSAAEQMATTFPYILTSGVLQRKVASELGMAAMPGVITVNAVENTNLLTISVRDTDPERANTTLQAVIQNYPSISEVIVGKVNMKILDESGVPDAPDNPKSLKKDILKGAIVGMGVGLAWVLVVTVLRKTIRREEDCPRYVNKRCFGSVSYVHFKERSRQVTHRLNILEDTISQEFKEAIRIIRNKVERSAKEHSAKAILITSALAGEGKSTIAVNLALSLAQDGKKVALVDCDLRNPSDSEILNIEAQKGLVDYLKKEVAFNECIQASQLHGKKKFLFVPGGKAIADGATLLGSDRMKKVVESLKEQMDYVILDSAPVGLLTDASVLAQYADGAVFIVKKDFAKAEHIMSGMEHLAESNIYIMGCVLNGE